MKLANKLRSLLAHSEAIRVTFMEDDDGLASSRRSLFAGALLGGMFSTLISGVFLTSMILFMMRDSDAATQNSFLGSVTMISLATGFAQMISPLIMERFPKRKKLLLILRVIYHLLNIGMLGIIPILPFSTEVKCALFLAVHLIASLIVQISSAAFSVWHVSDLPDKTRAHYFSLTNMISPMITSLLATCASFFLDKMEAGGMQYLGLSILRTFAMLTLPFQAPRYLLTVMLILIYSFGANFPGSYFTAYLLEDVGLSYALISGITLASIPIYLLVYPIWSQIIRRTSWLKTLAIATALYLTPYLLNAFTTEAHWFLYPVSAISAYFFAPGITLVFANLPYMGIPETNQTSYIAFYSTVNNLSGFLASTVSRFFVTATTGVGIRFLGLTFQNRQFVNFIPCVSLLLTAGAALFVEMLDRRKGT
ncbi:MAG: hypothetical protein MJ141_02745 [Clostridia bacterium]|nr:hypothetical protein [Clostridia bacterium]